MSGATSTVSRSRAVATAAAVGGLCLALGWYAHAESGGATTSTMYFSGSLTDAAGPLVGRQSLRFIFKKGGAQCQAPDVNVQTDQNGAFVAPISTGGCSTGFFDGADITYDILHEGVVIAYDQPVGAVPYAKYADVAWRAVISPTSNIARRTTAQPVSFVRVDGNDAACDGSVDVAHSEGVAPACAFATPQHAVDVLPEVMRHTAFINVGSGRYEVAAAGRTSLLVGRTGPLVIRRTPGHTAAVVLAGDLAAAPGVAAGLRGIHAIAPASLTVEDISIQHFTGQGLLAEHVKGLTLTRLDVTNNRTGVSLRESTTTLTDCAFNSNTDIGLHIIAGRTTAYGTLNTNTNTQGVWVGDNAVFAFAGSAMRSDNSSIGLLCAHYSTCSLSGPVTMATPYGLYAVYGAFIAVGHDVTITDCAIGLYALRGSQIQVAWGAEHTLSITGANATTSVGIHAQELAHILLAGPGLVAISSVLLSGQAIYNASFADFGGHSVSVTAPGRAAWHSMYLHGPLPLPDSCAQGSTCS